MGTGAKIAIGCGIAVLVAVIGTVAILGLGVWWAKGKVEEVAGEQKRIEAFQKKANENAFSAPADGIIAEDRLVKFLDVRKQVFVVYEKYKHDIEALKDKDKKQADLGDVRRAFNMVNDLRLAQAQAQADLGMSDDEYRFLVQQVYKTMWAAEVAKATGGKSVSEAASEAYRKAADQMKKASDQGGQAGSDDAQAAREAVEKGAADLEKQAEEMQEKARDMDVPPANVALFRKYEADIKKYAMSGLEWIGL